MRRAGSRRLDNAGTPNQPMSSRRGGGSANTRRALIFARLPLVQPFDKDSTASAVFAYNETSRGNLVTNESRRAFLATLSAMGAGTLLSPDLSFGQRAGSGGSALNKIDVHFQVGDLVTPSQAADRGERGAGAATPVPVGDPLGDGGAGRRPWTPEKAIQEMNRAGVAVALISPGGSVGFGGPATPAAQSREWNDYVARLVHDHKGRFGQWAALPLPDVDAALKEVEYALDTLKVDGFGVATNYRDTWLGDPSFRPLFEELNRRNAVVFVHPTEAPCCTFNTLSYMKYAKVPLPSSFAEWPMNTARAILSLMFSGVSPELPNVRFIFSHGGGAMPLIVSRITGSGNWPSVGPKNLRTLFPEGLEKQLSKFFYDTAAGGAARANFDALRAIVPVSQVLWGSDYPTLSEVTTAKEVEQLRLPPETKRAIERDNVLNLLPHLRPRLTSR